MRLGTAMGNGEVLFLGFVDLLCICCVLFCLPCMHEFFCFERVYFFSRDIFVSQDLNALTCGVLYKILIRNLSAFSMSGEWFIEEYSSNS